MIATNPTPDGATTTYETVDPITAELEATLRQLPRDERYTDTGDAKALEAAHWRELRHVTEWGWLSYEGGTWNKPDGRKAAKRRLMSVIEAQAHEALNLLGTDAGKHMSRHAHAAFNRVDFIVRVAECLPRLSARPEDFDAHANLFNCQNGVLDLRSGQLLPHSPAFLVTKQAPVTYDPDATAPRFLRFLQEIFLGDQALIDWMQKLAGCCLTGDTYEQDFYILYGGGKNGKTQFLKTLRSIMGSDYSGDMKPEVLMNQGAMRSGDSHDGGLAPLMTKRLVTSGEPQDRERHYEWDLPRIKRLTGDDGALTVRDVGEKAVVMRPQFKLLVMVNKCPDVPDATEGAWRRIKLIPFNARFEGATDEKNLADKMVATEGSGILNWMLAGAQKWYAEGLGDPPDSLEKATAEYHRLQDPYYAFFAETLEYAPGQSILRDTVYQDHFTRWFHRNRAEIQEATGGKEVALPSRTKFGKLAEEHNFPSQKRNDGQHLINCRVRHPQPTVVTVAMAPGGEVVEEPDPLLGRLSLPPESEPPAVTIFDDGDDFRPFSNSPLISSSLILLP